MEWIGKIFCIVVANGIKEERGNITKSRTNIEINYSEDERLNQEEEEAEFLNFASWP